MGDDKPKSVGEIFAELRQIAIDENYVLPEPPRTPRPNAFVEMLAAEALTASVEKSGGKPRSLLEFDPASLLRRDRVD